jgi:hypothetical protein
LRFRCPHRRTPRIGLAEEIGDEDHHRAVRQHLVEEIERAVGVGTGELRPEEEDIPHDPQHVAASLGRGNELLDRLGEEQQPDLVLVADRGEREHGRKLGHQRPFRLLSGAEPSGTAQVHHEHHGQLPLLAELLHERMVHPRGDVPVDGAHLVTGLVLANLVEVHPLPLEGRVVLAGERLGDQPSGADLDLPDPAEQFGGHP